jgi:[glutamine synthetase] adenylyltransferase / [glutamine synthetase]-adenylyl-L-tyrosine phosphorylase
MTTADALIQDLPDPGAARRFLESLAEKHPRHAVRLEKDRSLLSDALTLASFSPLLAATMLEHPEYLGWLGRKRGEKVVRDKDELLESLARFSLTNSTLEPHVVLARFRRRELLRIFLQDIRRLAAIAEITEEISNLADAILEHALRLARQELDNRYGSPLETDEKGREKPAEICIVSLGKLGSRELNYSSDIDLLFLYSAEGVTSGVGSRDPLTNREYFIKLAESVIAMIGRQTGEGAAYRVDLRLRPHGRVGPLALSAADTARYYKTEAAAWERQVLIRCRASAGDDGHLSQFLQRCPPDRLQRGGFGRRGARGRAGFEAEDRPESDRRQGHGC